MANRWKRTRQVLKVCPYYTMWTANEYVNMDTGERLYKVYGSRWVDGEMTQVFVAEFKDFLDVMSYVDQRL